LHKFPQIARQADDFLKQNLPSFSMRFTNFTSWALCFAKCGIEFSHISAVWRNCKPTSTSMYCHMSISASILLTPDFAAQASVG